MKKVIAKLPERRKVEIPKRMPGIGYGLPDILAYYVTSGLKANEQKKLNKFVQNIKAKSSNDRDLREETDLEFSRMKRRR